MKAILLAGASVLALGVTAQAADLYIAAPEPIAVAAAYNWNGLYLGLHGGYGGGQFDYPFSGTLFNTPVTGSLDLTSGGFFGGGQIGYNFQMNQFVLGVEADIAASGIDGQVSLDIPAGPLTVSAGSSLNWFGTVRGRLGVAFDNVLVYGTGGFAYGSTTTSIDVNGTNLFSASNTKSGWTVGGGVEVGLTPHLSLKAEYLYLDLGTDVIAAAPGITFSESTTAHTLKTGLNYRF